MNWLLFSLIAPAVWAVMNHFDKYLISRYCKDKSVGSLIVYSGIIGLPLAIVIAIFVPEVLELEFKSKIVTMLSGAVYLCAMICYLKALEKDETSVVAPLMQLSSIFSLLFGYFLFGELLNRDQIVGAVTLVLGSLGLTLSVDDSRKFKLKKYIFFLMLFSSLLLSMEGVFFKFVAIEGSFWPSVFWMYIGYVIYTILIFSTHKQVRKEFLSDFKGNSISIISLNLTNELLTVIGNLSFNFAILIAPIGLVYSVSEGTQPLFVLLYGVLITKFLPNLSEENLFADHIIQKVLAMLLMGVGIYLMS